MIELHELTKTYDGRVPAVDRLTLQVNGGEVFGLFHVVLAGGAAPERWLPSTMLGLLLGWLTWRSRSILPSILLHAVHNTTLLIMASSRDQLAEWNVGTIEQTHLPWTWLVGASLFFVLGILLVRLSPIPIPPFEAKAP